MPEEDGKDRTDTSMELDIPQVQDTRWEWTPGQEDLQVEIPEGERLPLPPSTALQGRQAHWVSPIESGYVPDLRGKTPEDVDSDAKRIKPGGHFSSLAEFDQCLHSWSVLNGRVIHRLKTKWDFGVRVCRFGPTVRTPWRTKNQGVTHSGEVDTMGPQDQAEIEEGKADNCMGGQDQTEVQDGGVDTDMGGNDQTEVEEGDMDSDAGGSTDNSGKDSGHHMGGEQDSTQGKENHAHEFIPKTSLQVREPLLPNTIQQAVGDQLANSRSIIRHHTSEWSPSSLSLQPNTGKKTKKQSPTGACGEQARILPLEIEQGKPTVTAACPFRVRCQRERTGRFTITVCNLEHTCPPCKHEWRGPLNKAAWLGETLAPRVVGDLKLPVREMLNRLREDYNITSNYHQVWRARDLIRDWYLGGQRKSFHVIPSLLQRLLSVDSDAVVDWSTEDGSKVFNRAFICPSATRSALTYSQPLVCLDAWHTKNREYPTQLFLATGLDGNMKVIILCYAIAPVENAENWTWFLKMLERSIHDIRDPKIPFISNRCKGLVASVSEVFPGKVHAHCTDHMRANVKGGFGKAAEQFFLGCVYANTRRRFDKLLDELAASVAKGAGAVEYIRNLDETLYARHAFPLPRLGKVTSNPVEQANSGLLEMREHAPFKLLVEMWLYVQKQFNDRRIAANARLEVLTDQAQHRHNVNLQSYRQWEILDDGVSQAKIQTIDHQEQYLVDLSSQCSCSCFELQEMLWPCEHVMAWDGRDGRDFSRHFHPCWQTASLRKLYEPKLPCFLSNDLEPDATCSPPEAAVKKGRHRVVRIESGSRSRRRRQLTDDEYEDAQGNLFRQYPVQDDVALALSMPTDQSSRQVQGGVKRKGSAHSGKTRCSLCGQVGHNKRTCATTTSESAEEYMGQPTEHADMPLITSQTSTPEAPPLSFTPMDSAIPDFRVNPEGNEDDSDRFGTGRLVCGISLASDSGM